MTLINTYDIIWSPKSKLELNNIYSYIKYTLKEPIIAKRISQEIIHSISNLKYFPLKNPKLNIDVFNDLNIRRLIVNNFVIIYLVDKNSLAVNILHIFNCLEDYYNKL